MSFALTTPQILARTKTVTRRFGWAFLRPGDLLQAIEKGQGLKKGERVRRLAVLRVLDVREEPLKRVRHPGEVQKEGFPELYPEKFISMFCRTHQGCHPDSQVRRIEFEYV
jgi:hypothetical protein